MKVNTLRRALFLSGCLLLSMRVVPAQTTLSPSAPDPDRHLRSILMMLAAPEFPPTLVVKQEEYLVRRFELTSGEISTIDAAAQSMRTVLARMRQSERAIVGRNAALSASDIAELNSLTAQRDQALQTVIAQVMQAVRPGTAALLRASSSPVTRNHP